MYNFMHGFRVCGEVNKWKIKKRSYLPTKKKEK